MTSHSFTCLEVFELEGTRLSNKVWNNVASLPCLRVLQASCVGLRDLKFLTPMTGLTELDLSWNEDIGDSNLHHLNTLKGLKKLNLAATGISDSGLRSLVHLRNFEYLDVSHNNHRITVCGVEHIACLNKLKILNVWNTRAGCRGALEYVSRLAKNTVPQLTG